MKLTMLLTVLFLSLAFCGKAGAQPPTGADLQSKCRVLVNDNSSLSPFDAGFCAGFINGVMNSQSMWEASDKLQKRSHDMQYCLPQEGGSNGQFLQVFMKYLDEHPEELHKPAASLLVESLIKAFPCEK